MMRALREAAKDGSPGSGSVGFNGDAPKDFGAFADDLAKRQAKKAEEAKETSLGLSTNVKRGIIHGLISAAQSGGRPEDKAFRGTVEGISETTRFNNTQGMCINGSGGMGWEAGGELCLVLTKKPDGASQLSLTRSATTTTGGWEFGGDINVSILKSNADDLEQLKGAGWNKSGSAHAGPLGVELNHGSTFNTHNSKGDPVQTFSLGAGPGVGAGASTGFTSTWGNVLWESPASNGSK